jgi:hypothetical protein
MGAEATDKQIICEMLQNWVAWRDAGDWTRFRSLWHDDGYIVTMWFQGPVSEFIRLSREGWHRPVGIQASPGDTRVDVAGHRAIAQTKIKLCQRARLHDVLCEVAGTGQFYDFLEKRAGNWGIVLHLPIYEKDWITPVEANKTIKLKPEILCRFPEGYRHLAYLHEASGYIVKTDMPVFPGPEAEALYRRGKRWLAGDPL